MQLIRPFCSQTSKLTQRPINTWLWSSINGTTLCLWFRASLIYINTCPTRCNTKQFIYYSASSLYTFRVSKTPIIRSTQICNCSFRYWSYFLCSYLPPTWPTWPRLTEVAAQKIRPVPEAVVTVLYTPDDGCGWHPKHVEWTCRIINRLLCVASRWTIINISGTTICSRFFYPTTFIWSLLTVFCASSGSLFVILKDDYSDRDFEYRLSSGMWLLIVW